MSLKILLSAFACDPEFGSDEEVGWQWAMRLAARGNKVLVVTRAAHRKTIDNFFHKNPRPASLDFIFLDLPRIHKVLSLVNRRNHIYYYFWQLYAYLKLKNSFQPESFDVVHHVTWVSFRQPSFLARFGKRSIFGPVAGGDDIPVHFMPYLSWTERVKELIRMLANGIVIFDPLMRRTYKNYDELFFTSDSHIKRIPPSIRHKARVTLGIGSDFTSNLASINHAGTSPKMLFVGRCIGWKGMDVGLRAFSLILRQYPEAILTIVGDGGERKRWVSLCTDLGISANVKWVGWIRKSEVGAFYQSHDLLFYPSLRDSGGFVVLEAASFSTPIVCFKLGGPGVVIDDRIGVGVDPGNDFDEAVDNFAKATIRCFDRLQSKDFDAEGFRARLSQFSWDQLISKVYSQGSR